MPSAEELAFVADQFQFYTGFVLFIIGSIGALFNMYILTQPSLRKSSCSLYLFSQSFSDLWWLINALFVRLLFYFGIKTYTVNDVYCPFRGYIIAVSSMCSIGCLCLAAFDRCMCTSRVVSDRRRSSRAVACRAIVGVFMIGSALNIPHLVYVRRITNGCSNLSTQFTYYINYFANPVLYGVAPMAWLLYFGRRTVANIHSLRRRTRAGGRLEHHFTRLLLIQITFSIVSNVPLMLFSIYFGITFTVSKSVMHRAVDSLVAQMVRLLNNLSYTSALYLNLIAMPEARVLLKKGSVCRNGQITPLAAAIPSPE